MTLAVPHILASDDGALIKLAFWGVVILIFGIAKFVKFVSKLFSPTNATKPTGAIPAMPNVKRPPPIAAGAIALPPLSAKAGKARRKVGRKVAPAQAPAMFARPLAETLGALQQPRIAPSAPPLVSVSRSRVAGWLDAPTIRAQFILAEAMKPPVSLR